MVEPITYITSVKLKLLLNKILSCSSSREHKHDVHNPPLLNVNFNLPHIMQIFGITLNTQIPM